MNGSTTAVHGKTHAQLYDEHHRVRDRAVRLVLLQNRPILA
jgi:hypothetical protein